MQCQVGYGPPSWCRKSIRIVVRQPGSRQFRAKLECRLGITDHPRGAVCWCLSRDWGANKRSNQVRLVVTGHPRGAVGICSLRGDWAERRSNRVGELVESGSELVDSSTFQDSFAADKAKPALSVNQG